MARLVVNPGSSAAWEIQLKPGANFIGRGFANDFKLTDPSVSGSHCQVIVSDRSVRIKDLGSTNGTYVNRAKIHEAPLLHGQAVHLGAVAMIFYANDTAPAGAAPAAPAAAQIPAAMPLPVAVPLRAAARRRSEASIIATCFAPVSSRSSSVWPGKR